MIIIVSILPLIVKSAVDVLRYPNPALSKVGSDIEMVISCIVGNSISLLSRVPDQGARINSGGEQPSSCPRGSFILGDVDGRLSRMRKHHLCSGRQLLHSTLFLAIIILRLQLSVTYEREVTGSDSTQAK
jgi:hypothetical protein